jgi:inner membrane protein
MPTIISHAAVPLAIGLGMGSRTVSPRLLRAGVYASMLPDIDVIGFGYGIAYGSDYGHRGFTHSLVFALAVALLGALFCRGLNSTFLKTFCFLAVATASHGILDAFTNGGLGVALLWPFLSERYFAPYPVIEVSPIGVSQVLTGRFARVLESEFMWIWLPCLAVAIVLFAGRWFANRTAKRREHRVCSESA